VQSIDYPGLELKDGPGVHPDNVGRKCDHGVILKVVSTNICGSDQHMSAAARPRLEG
jgi:glutathione-independent formaldehyde dehydrogenase